MKKPAKKSSKKAAKKTARKTTRKAAGTTHASSRKTPKKAPKKGPKARAIPTRAKGAAKPLPAKKTAAGRTHASSAKAGTKPPNIQRAIITTVLPPKLSTQARKVTSSTMPAQSAVKARKAPQAKLAAIAPEKSARKRLNKEELKYFENLLNEKKETLIQELDYIEDNAMRLNSKDGAGDLSSHAYHLADHATETQDREQAFHLASREGRFLYYIEEALDRVRAGTFGICKKCGTLIPKARLEAVPTAKMCINCKSRQEHATEGGSVMV
jgi:RNA polymerase-binding protein DksA